MPHFESAAYDLSIPGGIVCDDVKKIGSSLLLSELTTKGAGPYDSKALSDAFDEFGIRRGESAGSDRFTYRGSSAAVYFERALELMSYMVLAPRLPEEEISSIRNLFLQEIHSLNDNPAKRAMILLSEKYFPDPYSRPGIGNLAGIEATTAEDLREKWKTQFAPQGAVLSIAGKINASQIITHLEKHFNKWQGEGVKLPKYGEFPPTDVFHVESDSAQLQIVLAFPSAKFDDPFYYTAKVANQLLSGGMFGRLFIEVREKRGLCYSVYSRHSATCDYGVVQAYAGTTPERAHETLEVMLAEISRLQGTVTEDELARAKANLKASLIIGEESPGARAVSNASDWWVAKRVRRSEEIINEINKVQIKDIDQLIDKFPARNHTLLTLGSRDLTKFV